MFLKIELSCHSQKSASLKYVSTELPPFFLGIRVTVNLCEAIRNLSVSSQNYKSIQEHKRKIDLHSSSAS